MARLTVRALESLKPKSASYKVTVDRDLYMRVAVDGIKTWLVRYVIAGRQIQVRLPRPYGSSGADGHMSLAQAVAENVRIQALAHDGIDFQFQRAELDEAAKLAMAQAETMNTPFRVLFNTWLTDGVSREDGNAELRRTFDKDILPTIGDLPVREVNDGHLLELLRKVGRERGRGRTAERMLSECRQMYGWAIKRQPWRSLLTHGSPAELVELKQVVLQGYEPGIRERTLSVDELRELRDIFAKTTQAYEESANRTVAVRPLQMESQLALWICLGAGCRIG
ncbi:MAG: Arm DNA-binding domain-containing protein, partial [Gammaproteobacteria bacterium]|nr:Arm DNA-binding domain-containing protein [Gammaproteobacteria bacterium]